jgi:sugar phosphate isomerase/epimerase
MVGTYVELFRRFGELIAEHPNVGVLVDAFHIYASGERVDAALANGVESVVWVHLADPARLDRTNLQDHERALPGESGEGLCEKLLDFLAATRYEGPITVEPLGGCSLLERLDARQTAFKTRESLRRVWPVSSNPSR